MSMNEFRLIDFRFSDKTEYTNYINDYGEKDTDEKLTVL